VKSRIAGFAGFLTSLHGLGMGSERDSVAFKHIAEPLAFRAVEGTSGRTRDKRSKLTFWPVTTRNDDLHAVIKTHPP
jgi:hypothetical protein